METGRAQRITQNLIDQARTFIGETGSVARTQLNDGAQRLLESFDRAGIRQAADVTKQSLGDLIQTTGAKVSELRAQMKRCPVGGQMPSTQQTQQG